MLAMNLRAPRGVRCPASSLTTIASLLAPTGPWWPRIVLSFVGASMLAMNLWAPRGVRCPASSLTSIASMLAPTNPWRRIKLSANLAPTKPWWPRINVSAKFVLCRSEHAFR